MLTAERVRSLFDYQDGALYWREGDKRRREGVPAGFVSEGRAFVCLDGRKLRVHRLAYLWHHGELPGEIDHIDGNPLNNRIKNLRAVTHQQNMQNMKRRTNNKTGFKGVYYFAERKKWCAQISLDSKSTHLGIFGSPEEAYAAYCAASAKYHGQYGRVE
jgi:hypothetical protein